MKVYQKKSQQDKKEHWTPSQPIPRRGEDLEPNAIKALERNAEAYEQFKRDEQQRRVADRRAA